MNERFEKRLRGAVVAAWWTVGIWWVVLMVSWGAYLLFTFTRPGWLLALWGGVLGWNDVAGIWIFFVALLKVVMFLFLMVTVFLTLWLRQLKRAA